MAAPNVVSMLLLTIVTATVAGIMNVATTEATWCVVRSDASAAALHANLNWACSHGADCRPIQPGGSCYNPNTIQNHASYAYDSYYQRMGKAAGSCYFAGTATISVTDPSFGGCRYPPLESAGGADTSSTTKAAKNVDAKTLPVTDAH